MPKIARRVMLGPVLSSIGSDKAKFLVGLFWKIPFALVVMAVGTVLLFAFLLLDRDRMRQVFGQERGLRLHINALTMVANLPMPDNDRDGVPDWAKYYGPLSRDLWVTIGSKFDSRVSVYQGERTKVRIWNRSFGVNGVWAPGFRARVCADSPVLFLPGSTGPASEGPLELVTSPSGTLDFEMFAPDSRVTVELINCANGKLIGDYESEFSIPYRRDVSGFISYLGKRLPPIECRISDKVRREKEGFDPFDEVFVDFDLVPGATGYVLEMATRDCPNEWHPIDAFGAPDESSIVKFYAVYYRAAFRIVPTM